LLLFISFQQWLSPHLLLVKNTNNGGQTADNGGGRFS